jgi:hypothetical protein
MSSELVPTTSIERSIRLIRGQKVLLDDDLARLYGVSVKRLNEQVRRNIARFPEDFMFRIDAKEAANLRSQIATSSLWGGRRYQPMAFTEQGVAMLSSVLRSPRAVQVNVEIMRAFVRLRRMLESNAELSRKLDALERKYDGQFRAVFEAIRELMTPARKPGKRIGFRVSESDG